MPEYKEIARREYNKYIFAKIFHLLYTVELPTNDLENISKKLKPTLNLLKQIFNSKEINKIDPKSELRRGPGYIEVLIGEFEIWNEKWIKIRSTQLQNLKFEMLNFPTKAIDQDKVTKPFETISGFLENLSNLATFMRNGIPLFKYNVERIENIVNDLNVSEFDVLKKRIDDCQSYVDTVANSFLAIRDFLLSPFTDAINQIKDLKTKSPPIKFSVMEGLSIIYSINDGTNVSNISHQLLSRSIFYKITYPSNGFSYKFRDPFFVEDGKSVFIVFPENESVSELADENVFKVFPENEKRSLKINPFTINTNANLNFNNVIVSQFTGTNIKKLLDMEGTIKYKGMIIGSDRSIKINDIYINNINT